MATTGEKVGIVALIIGAAGGAAYALTRKVSKCPSGQVDYNGACTSAVLKVSAEYSSVDIKTPDTITATLTDTSGNPLEGVAVTFLDTTTGASTTGTTDANGVATATVTFLNTGRYSFTISA
jgi:hypothetical protein